MTLEEAMDEIFGHGFVFTLRPKKALEALKVIRKTLLDYEQLKSDYIELDNRLRTANTEIDRLQSVSSWIPCSERMPDDDEEVLFAVIYPWDKKTRVTLGRRRTKKNGESWWSNGYCHFSDYDVTHWMPLPEPPQRKDDTHDND